MGIKYLWEYEDIYYPRQMKTGEVGCFLSHYKIWEQMIERGEKEVLVLEDDVKFEPNFITNAMHILKQIREVPNWDFLYFSREDVQFSKEIIVPGTENIVYAEYSYWTVGYVITREGAKKLINSKPLEYLLPVDEYLPIMIRSDHNEDDSIAITKLWLKRVEPLYHNVDFAFDESQKTFYFSKNRVHWSNDRFAHIISLKEEAFQFARRSSTDFVFFCDVDVLLTNPKTLDILIKLNLPIVSPMLISANHLYSNFWALEEEYTIIMSQGVGEFKVSMVHSAVL
uniref:Glycosyl transferase family 25 domain-containing protein n=1 Tax=Megaselia scalaris TaxID=36166 RepID=T1GDG5_MEGSC